MLSSWAQGRHLWAKLIQPGVDWPEDQREGYQAGDKDAGCWENAKITTIEQSLEILDPTAAEMKTKHGQLVTQMAAVTQRISNLEDNLQEDKNTVLVQQSITKNYTGPKRENKWDQYCYWQDY